MDQLTLAYLAGIIDGEGSIGISWTRPSARNPHGAWTGYINCSMTDEEPIRLLYETFGGYLGTQKPKLLHWRLKYIWSMTSTKACITLNLLLPYLRIKKRQALLCFKLQTLKQTTQRHDLKQAELDARYALWLEMSALNKRG